MQNYAAEKSVQAGLVGHFGLGENPFGVTPDPRFLFLSQTHREALASLINGIDCGFGFQALVAQPGMGKTTLLFNFLERFRTTAHTAFLFQPQLAPHELLQSVLLELGTSSEETSLRKLSEQLNQVLGRAAQERKRVIVVVDEAQGLEFPVLEALRQLSNFETPHSKLMQVVLSGQPQLAKKLASPEQEQLRQRISTIGRLSPLALHETHAYITHRLKTAGYRGVDLFTPGAVRHIWNHSKGIPRNINTLCFNAMLLAFAEHAQSIDERNLEEAIRDLDPNSVTADLYHMERPLVVSNNKVRPIREPELPETHNARKEAIEEPVKSSGSSSRETGATAAPVHSGERSRPGVGEDIPPALVEAIARICLAQYEQKVLLAAKTDPSTKALPAATPTPLSTALPSTRLDTTAVAAIETPASSGKAFPPQPSVPIPASSVAAIPGDSTVNPGNGSPLKTAGTTIRPKPKPALDIAPPQPGTSRAEQSFLSKNLQSSLAAPKKCSANGSPWLALSFAAVTGMLGLMLVGKFPLQRPGQVEARGPSQSASVHSDLAARYSGPTTAPASATNVPIPPADSRGPRNVDSEESEEVIVRRFPADSKVAPEALGNAQPLTSIFFDQDSAVIRGQYRPALQQIADALAENPKATAILEGHTDSSGPEAYNLDLSSRRAIAVRNALVNELHVSRTQLTAIGSGSAAPVQPNSSAAGRAYNRRVEIRLVPVSE